MVATPVLVGVDGSASSLDAVTFAVGAAALRKAPVRLVFVDSPTGSGSPDPVIGPALQRARSACLAGAVTAAVVHGATSSALVAASAGALLTVVGHRGGGGLPGLLLGLVVVKVAAHAHGPVVVVRVPGDGDREGVVVGIDGAPADDAALDFALDEAALRHCAVTAVHATAGPEYHGPADALQFDPRTEEARAVSLLAGTVERWQDKYPEARIHRTVRWARPATALVDAAHDAQLLVLGTLGRGGLTGPRLGAVCHTVLHHAACPVALVHP